MYQTSCESSWWQRSPYPFGPPRSGGGVAAGSSPGALGPPPSPWRGGPPGPACFLRPSGSAWLWLFGGLPGGRGLLSVALLGRCVGVCVWACVGIILGDLGSWRIWLGRRMGSPRVQLRAPVSGPASSAELLGAPRPWGVPGPLGFPPALAPGGAFLGGVGAEGLGVRPVSCGGRPGGWGCRVLGRNWP